MTESTALLKQQLLRFREELEARRNAAGSMEELAGHPVERPAGIWEMDFDDLEKEIWSRFENLEYNADCLEKKDPPENQGLKDRMAAFILNTWRNIKNPLVRLYMQKYWRFNLDRQNQINRDNVPYQLAHILTLQKMKDRLNRLEEQVQKTQREQRIVYEELLELRSRLRRREKSE